MQIWNRDQVLASKCTDSIFDDSLVPWEAFALITGFEYALPLLVVRKIADELYIYLIFLWPIFYLPWFQPPTCIQLGLVVTMHFLKNSFTMQMQDGQGEKVKACSKQSVDWVKGKVGEPLKIALD